MRNVFALLVIGAAIAPGCSSPTTADILAPGDEIKYLIDKDQPPEGWFAAVYDDSKWQRALGAIGPLQADAAGVMPAVLTRSLFDLGAQASSYKSLTLSLDVPGGFTAFVNGTKMVSAQDGKSASLDLPDGLVQPSNNTLAIEIHPPSTANEVAVAPKLDGQLDPAAAAVPHIVRGPWLLGPTPNGISIQWETNKPVASQAIVDGKTYDGGAGAHHSVLVTNLSPSSAYKYHVVVGDDASPESDLVTAPAQGGERVKFVVYGDNRTDGDAHRQVIDGIGSEGADFIVNTGDLVDSSSNGEWQIFFDIEYDLLRRVPMLPTLGNHEANSGGAGRFAELFPLGDPKVYGGRVYSKDFGDVHIAVLDSNGDLGSQAGWLEQDLTAAEQRGARHEFIVMHQGAYSGSHALMHGSNEDAQEHIVPVARRHPVDALLAGHDHFYERGQSQNLAYFVAGGGGAPLEPCSTIPETIMCRSMHHYLVVEVQGGTATFTAKDSNGNAFDQFVVNR
jgi:Calcineurin-like phosphoesterase